MYAASIIVGHAYTYTAGLMCLQVVVTGKIAVTYGYRFNVNRSRLYGICGLLRNTELPLIRRTCKSVMRLEL